MQSVHEAASRAIGKLGDLDLVRYEDSPVDGSADLSLWEEIAPIVGSTIADVNGLIAEVEVHFSPGSAYGNPNQIEIGRLIGTCQTELREGVMELGQRIRDPSVVGDRWNLIAELQTFRFRFRERIGQMVYETAQILGECRRSDVDPGYEEALASTLVVRSTTADLRRLVKSRLQKISEAHAEDVDWNGKQLEKELNAFGRTAAWRALRAQDKKEILEFRARLKTTLQPGMSKLDLMTVVEPFVEFVEGFQEVNNREFLKQHDRELQASVGVILERAMTANSHDESLTAFNEAVNLAQALYGRSSDFDAFLRKLRKTPPAPEGLQHEIEQFLVLIAGLSME